MQDAFEKIISKINEKIEHYDSRHKILTDSGMFSDADRITERMAELDFAKEIVKQEAEKHDNGWISCSSGVMPRANGWYLVTNRLGVVQEQRWSANHWEKLRDDAVLAWRELPQPYQPKGE